MHITVSFFIFILICGVAHSGKKIETTNPDFTKGEPIPQNAPHTWNLGPTGLRGWMYTHRLETSDARQIMVTYVKPNTPAHGRIHKGDVILGVGEQAFSYDPRTEFGKSIRLAEETGNGLNLILWRKGKNITVNIPLTKIGSYSNTAPYHCSKSDYILKAGIHNLASRMDSNQKFNHLERAYNCLALLAYGDEKHWPIVKKHIATAINYRDPERRQLHSWFYGAYTIMVAEYTLATGDQTFLPQLTRLCNDIINGQSNTGTWGHKFIQKEDKVLSGYGMMHATGIPLTTALVLAKMAGVNAPNIDTAISKSSAILAFYIDKGSIPYGDHPPFIKTHDDNGKNGAASILFNLLDHKSGTTFFTQMSVATHGGARDQGHTGNFLNILWALPSVALSGEHATGEWMKEFSWYYDLARKADGSFHFQGPPEPRNTAYHGWDCTGVFMLAYAQSKKKIYLTGKKPSIAPQVSQATARSLVKNGQGWSPKKGAYGYKELSNKVLIDHLKSWSPIVRSRSSAELASRKHVSVEDILPLLDDKNIQHQLGALAYFKAHKNKASQVLPHLPALRKKLKSNNLWVRIKAAEAIISIGPQAFEVLPELLELITNEPDKHDPRQMQRRYITSALFAPHNGLLKQKLNEIDARLLNQAIISSLQNPDGKARKDVSSIYSKLSYAQIKPLLPAIYKSVREPSPSGIMFSDHSRLEGLKLLAKHRVKEGLPYCVKLIDPGRWGLNRRIKPCTEALKLYGSHAVQELPKLIKIRKKLNSQQQDILDRTGIITFLQTKIHDDKPLRSIK